MLQRVQSVFLALVLALSLLLLILPVYEYSTGLTAPDAIGMKPYLITDNVLLTLLNGVVGFLSLLTIFLFKNRSLQIRLTGLTMLLTCVLVGLLFFLADNLGSTFDKKLTYRYGAYLPILQLIFTFLAQRAIRRDEELVRSADRLR